MKLLYGKFAKYYDLIYKEKKYDQETKFILNLIRKNKIKGKELLEVGCGTGSHTLLLKKKGFSIVGIDLSKEMLKVAKNKVKRIKFLWGNMKDFNLNKQFDILVCLFSVMHYNKNYLEIEKTIRNFYRHLKKGGLVIFDMGFNKERFEPGHLSIQVGETKDVTLVRIGKSFKINNEKAKIVFSYVLMEKDKVSLSSEEHRLAIFNTLKIKELMEKIGFDTKLYENYKNKPWTKTSKKYVIFVGIKK